MSKPEGAAPITFMDKERLTEKYLEAHNKVGAMSPDALTQAIYLLPDLLDQLSYYHKATRKDNLVFLVDADRQTLFQPLSNDSHAMMLMRAYRVTRNYEHYNCIGEHYSTADGRNPLVFLENDVAEEEEPLFSNYPMHTCICRAVVLNYLPEMVAHLA